MMNGKMYLSRKMNATTHPITIPMREAIRRLRSSSRCSRNDIRPASSSTSCGSVSSMRDLSSSSRADCGSGRSRVGTGAIALYACPDSRGKCSVLALVGLCLSGGDGRWLSWLRRADRARAALLLDADFLVESVPQLVGGALELAETLAERTAELWQFSGPEDDERERQDDEQLGHPDWTKHKANP